MPLSSNNENFRLVLGTAQLGMRYGCANRTGQPDFEDACKIVLTAWENGIEEYDTAQAYGDSEKILGQIFKKSGLAGRVKVTSKLNPQLDHLKRAELEMALLQSLERLNLTRLYCLMLHRQDHLDLWNKGLRQICQQLRERGLVERVGISVYSPERALVALKTDGISVVQLPTSIFDRRFEKARVFDLAHTLNKEIYIRSVFLQGLLLMDYKQLPQGLRFAEPHLRELMDIAQFNKLPVRNLALGYVKHTKPNAKVVVGIETVAQLRENIMTWNRGLPSEILQQLRVNFQTMDERMINPTLWETA